MSRFSIKLGPTMNASDGLRVIASYCPACRSCRVSGPGWSRPGQSHLRCRDCGHSWEASEASEKKKSEKLTLADMLILADPPQEVFYTLASARAKVKEARKG